MPPTEPATLSASDPTSQPRRILVKDVTDGAASAAAGVYTYNSGNGRWENGVWYAEKGAGVESYEFSNATDIQYVVQASGQILLGVYIADGDFTGTLRVTTAEPVTLSQA